MKMAALAVVFGCVCGLAAMFYVVCRWLLKADSGVSLAGAVVGGLFGMYLVGFHIFPEMGPSLLRSTPSPKVKVTVPLDYREFVYLFFDPSLPAPQGSLVVGKDGKLLTGIIPGLDCAPTYEVTYPNGTPVPLAEVQGPGGSFNSVIYRRFFVGTQAEHDKVRANLTAEEYWDEETVYRRLKSEKATKEK